MPGLGGTQRLTRLVGKSKAMEMCLTGRFMDAAEAERSGLVSRVVPARDLMRDARETAQKIAEKSPLTVRAIKEAVNRSYETTLREGVVSGVRPGGCAERAGLANGMRLSSWSVNFGQVNQPIEVNVRAGQETLEIKYLPHGTPVRGYRVEKNAR